MKKLIIASATALLLSTTPSYADTMDDIGDTIGELTNDLQFGAGIGFIDLAGLNDTGLLFYGIAEKEIDVDLGDTTNAVQVRLGTSTAASSSSTLFGTTVKSEASFNYLISALFKSNLELKDGISAYGLLGFSYASIDATASVGATSATSTSTDSSLSYGLGVEYAVDSDIKVAAEYAAYWSDATAFSANVYFNF